MVIKEWQDCYDFYARAVAIIVWLPMTFVRIGQLRRFPQTSIERSGGREHQGY